jgi:hypothetical protein
MDGKIKKTWTSNLPVPVERSPAFFQNIRFTAHLVQGICGSFASLAA